MPKPDQPPVGALLGLVTSGAGSDEILDLFSSLGTIPIEQLSVRQWEALAESVRRQDDTYPANLAWRAAYGLRYLGHTERSFHFLTNADRTELDDAERAQFCAAWASSAWGSGDEKTCESLTAESFEAAEASGDDNALAAAWESKALLAAMHGESAEDRRGHERALEHATAAGADLMASRVLNNLGSQLFDESRYEDSLEQFGHALRLAEATGHLSSIALVRHNLADVMLHLGRLDEALVEVEAARALWNSVDSPMVGAAWQVLADIQRARGSTVQATMAYREALAVASLENETQTLVPALVGTALISVATDPEEARLIVKQLLHIQVGTGQVPALTTAGWIALQDGDTDAAISFAAEAVAEASRRQARAALAEALELSVLAGGVSDGEARLREAASIWEGIGNPIGLQINAIVHAHLFGTPFAERLARASLRSLGVQDDAYGIAGQLHVLRSDADGVPIRVHTLGTFVLYRSGKPVAASEWPSRKARDVLKILAARGTSGIRREEIADMLWPDDDDPGSKLSVALSHLRRVLDPDKQYDPSHFIIADRASIRLDINNASVDVVEFRGAASESLAAHAAREPGAIDMLEAAAAMHTGDFLADDLYEDWAAEARDEVEGLGGEVVRVLAFALAKTSDPQRSVGWFARLLTYDPHDEPTYEALIWVLAEARRHGEARRYHRMYEMRMRELDVPAQSLEEMTG
ncbi:tetratricopeptide repeat protein [Aeromicrobium sp.]|uniref:AfsR/SARP family transcriptional regulator n=1 Tax=Aeromicrobium sp. TaxID=1871063 RepID=UPI003C313E57